MTFTVPRQGPPAQDGPTVVRRFGVVYGYDVRDHHTDAIVPNDYVGQSRVPELRDRQHRGLAPQRDGRVKEQPWADRIVGAQRILTSGMFTDAELDAEEIRLIHALKPRLNARDNPNPNRIPIYTQHEQRKARDPNWAIPDWSRRPAASRPVPGRLGTVWRWLSATLAFRAAVSWLLVALAVCVAVAWGSHAVGHLVPVEAALAAGAVVSTAVHVKYWKTIRRRLRRL